MNKIGGAGTTILITLGIISFLGLMTIFWVVGSYNSLVDKDVNVENKWAYVQSALQRQADLIPNLVNTVKGYSTYEGDVQKSIAQFRSGIKDAKSPSELDSVGKQMNSLISNLIVSVEAYPDLKANENYLALQDELAGTQNRITFERNNYNTAVKEYQLSVRTFPRNIIASMFNFEESKWEMFEATETKTPVVDFN